MNFLTKEQVRSWALIAATALGPVLGASAETADPVRDIHISDSSFTLFHLEQTGPSCPVPALRTPVPTQPPNSES